jgi:hypothetical protein
VRLGHAVAASSCVPGLFDPLVIESLYPDRVVRLVDGGVHDNQGARALLDQDCTVLFISDASGQMAEDHDPSQAALGVLLRTNGVLQARLRVAQHQEIDARRRGGLAREVLFAHMKQDLAEPAIEPLPAWTDDRERAEDAELTSYGIRKDVQRALAGIRTDLDSFTHAEGYALMTSGYRIAERVLAGSRMLEQADRQPDDRQEWRFLALEPAMRGNEAASWSHQRLLRHLRVASQLGFKVWSLDPILRVLRWVLLAGVVAGAIAWAISQPRLQLQWEVNIRSLLIAAAILGLGYYWKAGSQVAGFIRKLIDFRSTLMRIAGGFAMGTVGWMLASLHLLVFDSRFLALGQVEEKSRHAAPLPKAARATRPPVESWRVQPRIRPQTTLLALLGAAAAVVGMLPFVRFLDWWTRSAAITSAVLVSGALFVAFKSLDTRPCEATEAPSRGEWLLGWCSALQESASGGLIALSMYGLAYGVSRGWNALATSAGWTLQLDGHAVAFRVAVVICAVMTLSAASMAVRKMQRNLYPPTAGARSVYFPLLNKPRRLFAIGAAIAVLFVALLILSPDWMGMSIAAVALLYGALPLALIDRQARPVPGGITETAAAVLQRGGYTVIQAPRTGNPEVDPLIHNVTLVARSGATTFAIEVKDLGSAKTPLEWNAASAVRTAATVLQQELWSQPNAPPRVRPVLVVAGGEITDSLRRFTSVEGVALVHLEDAGTIRGQRVKPELIAAALKDAGIPLPAQATGIETVVRS